MAHVIIMSMDAVPHAGARSGCCLHMRLGRCIQCRLCRWDHKRPKSGGDDPAGQPLLRSTQPALGAKRVVLCASRTPSHSWKAPGSSGLKLLRVGRAMRFSVRAASVRDLADFVCSHDPSFKSGAHDNRPNEPGDGAGKQGCDDRSLIPENCDRGRRCQHQRWQHQ